MNCIKNGKFTGYSCFGCKISAKTCDIRYKLLYRPRWISVAERLPECEWGAETSALLYQHKETETIEVGYYGRGGKIRDSYFRHYRNVSDGIDSSDVIAWMPLPEPYKPQNLAYADNDTAQPGLQSAT